METSPEVGAPRQRTRAAKHDEEPPATAAAASPEVDSSDDEDMAVRPLAWCTPHAMCPVCCWRALALCVPRQIGIIRRGCASCTVSVFAFCCEHHLANPSVCTANARTHARTPSIFQCTHISMRASFSTRLSSSADTKHTRTLARTLHLHAPAPAPAPAHARTCLHRLLPLQITRWSIRTHPSVRTCVRPSIGMSVAGISPRHGLFKPARWCWCSWNV